MTRGPQVGLLSALLFARLLSDTSPRNAALLISRAHKQEHRLCCTALLDALQAEILNGAHAFPVGIITKQNIKQESQAR